MNELIQRLLEMTAEPSNTGLTTGLSSRQRADILEAADALERSDAGRTEALKEALRKARDEASFYANWECTPTYGYRDECVRPSMNKLVAMIDRALKSHPLRQQDSAEWVKVPAHPTNDMLRAGLEAMFEDGRFSRDAEIMRRGYKAMLSAVSTEGNDRKSSSSIQPMNITGSSEPSQSNDAVASHQIAPEGKR